MILSKNLLLLFFSGISAVTLIDTLGAIASRKFNFKYEILALFSFSIYLLIGFLVRKFWIQIVLYQWQYLLDYTMQLSACGYLLN